MKINKPILAALVFIVTLAGLFLFLIPKYQQLHELQNSITQKEADYNGKRAYYANISEIYKNIESKKDTLEKVDSALPSSFSFASLVYFFQTKGDENGLTLKSISFPQISLATPDQQVRNVPIRLALEGNYQGLKNFLFSLDRSARLFEVGSISFASSSTILQGLGQHQIYSFTLEVETNTY